MSTPSFSIHAEQTVEDLMSRLEEIDALEDCDMDIIDGVFELEFDDGSKLIINRQEPVQQLWLASPEGPAHFGYNADTGEWENDKTGESLKGTLERVLSQKTGSAITL
jgi:CyaY protein